jgi:glutamate-1-semialdehyde 2,1-aminomutase
MVAGLAAMHMLPPAAYDRLATLGARVREGLADLFETRDVPWQVTGQASLFKIHPHPRTVIDYPSAVPSPEEQAQLEHFYAAMFEAGVILTPELAGCLSTVMTEAEVDQLLAAAQRALD